MIPPIGLSFTTSSDVCKLKWSLYGLKQAPCAWFDKFDPHLLDSLFSRANMIPLCFLCKTATGIILLKARTLIRFLNFNSTFKVLFI